jgi:hypothetical protein
MNLIERFLIAVSEDPVKYALRIVLVGSAAFLVWLSLG